MAAYPYRLVNVFTQGSTTLSGNALCVFEDGSDLPSETMQAIARQFNLSETTFLLPATRATARVRIFTPDYELPFAGHPTLGSAHVCRALGRGGDELSLETEAGVIAVRARGPRWTLQAPVPTWREITTPLAAVAQALELELGDIGARPLWVKAGTEQLIVPLTSIPAVRRARAAAGAAALTTERGAQMAYVFAYDGPHSAEARFFFSQGGAMLEDPATGSATANFGGWCLAMDRPLPIEVNIAQGALVRRPSSLYLTVTAQRQIEVGGDVIEIGGGTLRL